MRQLAEMIRQASSGERGVALPMALFAMLVLTTLMLAFLSLSSSEPQIAANHLRKAQARALAEAGLERAIWALSNPTDSAGLADPLPLLVPAPYNGSTLVSLGSGGYTVSVTNSAPVVTNQRLVTSTGWIPDSASPRAKQVITATLTRLRRLALDAPCALCVRGELQISGNASIDARPTTCGPKVGTFSTDTTAISGNAAAIYGADGNNIKNQATDVLQNQPTALFDAFALTSTDLNTLKAIAKAQGTYYQGSVTFNAANLMPNGIIFVDTTTGNNIVPATPDSEFASLEIHGNAAADPSGVFKGWVISNGAVRIDGNFQMQGLVYSVNDLSYQGIGTGNITGLVISQNIRDVVASSIDSTASGNSRIIYNCNAANDGGGQLPPGWLVQPGSWREVEG